MARDNGKMSREEAGRKGGNTVKEKYGPQFFEKIGKKGGAAVSENRQHMQEMGEKGAKARNK